MARSAKSTVPWRNRSPYGWWLASYIVRFELRGSRPRTDRSRCMAWENTIIVRGKTREIAYRRALAVATVGTGTFEKHGDPPGRLARWVFEGLTSLVAIYEPLEDGSEIAWTEYSNITLAKLRRKVKVKRELETFVDETPNPRLERP
jgi:hypothetical protein